VNTRQFGELPGIVPGSRGHDGVFVTGVTAEADPTQYSMRAVVRCMGGGRIMPGGWFQRILTGLWSLLREVGRLPEYAAEAERLHQEIHAGEGPVAAPGEKPLLLSVVDTEAARSAHGL